ncbi:hypothetical protein [Rhizobium phaseoli]|uniref:hypothetical protein n=1 Tax=Rhizobium phaseoli TaxID=396 RepID=UPI0011AE5BFE|nr:hypothetical protein [Rhizobium phaseoli]
MAHPLYPLILEAHYKCSDSSDGQWHAAEMAFSDEERKLIAKAVDCGYLKVDPYFDFGYYLSITITRYGRTAFALPQANSSKAERTWIGSCVSIVFTAVRRRLFER